MNPSRIAFSVFILCFHQYGFSDKVLGFSLTDLAFEFLPGLDLHLVFNENKENLVTLSGSYYTSLFHNQTGQLEITTSTVQPTTRKRNTMQSSSIAALKNILPSTKPDLLTSGQNLIPLKSFLKVESVAETIKVLIQISSSELIRNSSIFPHLVVVWPERVLNEDAAFTLMHSNQVQDACQGFSIASELIFVLQTATLAKPMTMNSLNEDFYFYEVFNINSRHIVLKASEGVVDFHCQFCRGVAIRRHNFHGLQLNVSAMQDPEINDDLNFETTAAGDLIFSNAGFSARILHILQTSLNFTVKAIRASDWGKFVAENKSWVGSVKDVRDGQAQLGLALTTMRPARAQMVSFLPAADEGVISAFFRNPDLNAVRDIFARPFHPDLWAAVFSTWIVLAFFMILFSVIRKRYDLHLESGQPEPDFTNDSFIWALATACQQGWDDHPVAGSLRTIFISGSFTGVVAYAGYSAAIEQLLKSSLKIGIRQGFINEILQQNNTNDIMTSYQQKLKASSETERFFNITTGYKHLLKHRYAFISTRDNMYDNLKVTTNDSEICLLKELQILQHGFPAGHFVSRNSPLKEFLRYIYVTIREPGISWKLRGNYTYKRRCLEASDSTGNALGPNDVFTAFMILSGGYFLSIAFIIIEKLFRVSKTFSYIR
ncbi:uncharacterized protein LOC118434407 isoform X2 [Folsomia candida]|uniref:uncharacterized protein LOC118434407 isoform X2 n=1 Tax=Folsomia candida TaxID=158441 RepID=UPI0016055EA4|nr:uncharacterized protein LOC118434407 isoform X2 [Folsomia candida]